MNIKNIIFILIFLLLLILVSPRIKFKNEFSKKLIPKNIEEIDNYLLKEELQFNLESNTKKEIIWYKEKDTKNKLILWSIFMDLEHQKMKFIRFQIILQKLLMQIFFLQDLKDTELTIKMHFGE